MIDEIQKRILEEVADLHTVPEGAYNIRANSKMAARNTTANIDIISKDDGSGIDIKIKPGTKNESVHIPVVLSQSGLKEVVDVGRDDGASGSDFASDELGRDARRDSLRLTVHVFANGNILHLGSDDSLLRIVHLGDACPTLCP